MIHTIKSRPEIFPTGFFIIIPFLFFRPQYFLIQVTSGLALLETYSGKNQVRGATPYAGRDKPFPIRFETPQSLEQKDEGKTLDRFIFVVYHIASSRNTPLS